jgi:alkylhydroperoxidase family enzyme
VEATVIGGPAAPVFGPRERALLAMCDELHETARLSDAAWQALAEHFAPDQIVELLALAGFYHAISFLANGLRVEPERFAPGFPGSR